MFKHCGIIVTNRKRGKKKTDIFPYTPNVTDKQLSAAVPQNQNYIECWQVSWVKQTTSWDTLIQGYRSEDTRSLWTSWQIVHCTTFSERLLLPASSPGPLLGRCPDLLTVPATERLRAETAECHCVTQDTCSGTCSECHCLWQSAWAPAEETVTLEEVLHPGRQFLGSICKPKLPFTANRCFQSCLHSQMWEIQSPRDMGSGRTEKRQTVEQQAGCWASALAVKYFKCHL